MKTRLSPICVARTDDRLVRAGGRNVQAVLDHYVIRGRWWEREVCRRYVRVRLEGGAVLDLFEEEGRWFVGSEYD